MLVVLCLCLCLCRYLCRMLQWIYLFCLLFYLVFMLMSLVKTRLKIEPNDPFRYRKFRPCQGRVLKELNKLLTDISGITGPKSS